MKRSHLFEGISPFCLVTLNLEGVSDIWAGPDNEVAGEDNPSLWNPNPGGIVCFSHSKPKLESYFAKPEGKTIMVGYIWIMISPENATHLRGNAKLYAINEFLLALQFPVTVEASNHIFVANYSGLGISPLLRIF
jgi:hypothetical protein